MLGCRKKISKTQKTLESWPGKERRWPSIRDRNYLILMSLSREIQKSIKKFVTGRTSSLIIDAGCGSKPYYPYFAPYCSEYIGIDMDENSLADIRAPAEALPFQDSSADLVVSLQAAEHFQDPEGAVHEFYRILRPGGLLLVSTHGFWGEHGYSHWTKKGLERLLSAFQILEIVENGYAILSLFQLINLLIPSYLKFVIPLTNILGFRLDQIKPKRGLTLNYLVIASKHGR